MTVEVTFYVLLPVFGALAWRVTRGLRLSSPVKGELAVIAALVVVRLAYQPFHTLALEPLVYFLDWFLYGMLMAVVSAWIDHTGARPSAVAAIERHPNLCWLAAFAVYAIFAVRLADHAPTFGDHLLQGLFAGLVLLPAVFVGSGHGAARSVLRNPVLAWLGLISYGLYLWHFPVIAELSHASFITELPFGKLATLSLISVAITVACAAVSYYLLERPLLRFKRTRRARALPARQAA
jgi:peptidoglycan/LPS O-acetylase OafA/YrhL